MQDVRELSLVLAFTASLFGCTRSSPGSVIGESKDPEAGCEKGKAEDCFEAGVKYDSPETRTPDLGRAASYYRKACDLGNPTACDNLGSMHSKGDGVPKDAELAFTLYSKGCEAAYPVACFHVARAHETGSGTPARADKAAHLYDGVCATDSKARTGYPSVEKAVAAACFNLGTMKFRGLGVPADIPEGRRLFELGCTRGNADSCTAWGVALQQTDAKRSGSGR
jgi:uncharacterized protein